MSFAGSLGVQQRVVPDYRRGFFDLLSRSSRGRVSVFAGQPRPGEGVLPAADLGGAEWVHARNIHVLSGRLYVCLQAGVRHWLEAFQPDVLVLETNPREMTNFLAAGWMRRRGRPVLGWGLGAPLRPAGRSLVVRLRRAIRRAGLRGLSGVIAYSAQGKREFEALGMPGDRVFVAPNAVAPRPPPASTPGGAKTRGSHEPPENRLPRLLFVGRLQPRKRVDVLLEACSELESAVEVWIVGDGPARAALERLAGRCLPSARFLGDRRGPELESLFDQADLFVLPGTGGLAVQQALAHSLPVIVAAGDGTQQDMVTTENGWRVADGDWAGMRQAIAEALADRGRLAQMGAASRRLAEERFNIEAMADAFLKAVEAVAGRGA